MMESVRESLGRLSSVAWPSVRPIDPNVLTLRSIEEPFFIRPTLLSFRMNPRVAWRELPSGERIEFAPKTELFARGNITLSLSPVDAYASYRFMKEIHDGVHPFETELYRRIRSGERFTRHIGAPGTRRKIRLRSKRQFLLYTDRVRQWLETVATNGVAPICQLDPDDDYIERGREGDVGVGIANDGLVYFGKGKHRLAAALITGVQSIPCQCCFVSVATLERYFDKDCDALGDDELRELAIAYLEARGTGDTGIPGQGTELMNRCAPKAVG